MINRIIRASLENRALVLLLTVMLAAIGVHAVLRTPVDALPDLSDVQVIVRTPYPGQAPRVVEDQVTYPLTTALLSVPGATTVRGYSFYGDSFVNVLFADGTDPYWARSRVLEYLSQATARLPEGVRPVLGTRCNGRGLDLPVRARRPHRRSRPRAVAQPAGLVPQVRAAGARRRRRGRDDRRHGQAVPGGRGSAAPARLRHPADDGREGDSRGQPGSRRLGDRDGRGRVHGACHGLRQEHRRPRDASR